MTGFSPSARARPTTRPDAASVVFYQPAKTDFLTAVFGLAMPCSVDSLVEASMRAAIAFLIILALGAAAYASETITYQYDARGRLVQVSHSGSVNNNLVSNYTLDKADNRTNKTTTGSPNPPPP
jgi:hypothetical protein